jgi:cellobiose phosphorylase
MNLVGHHGQGESVWLAFFLYDVLRQFATLAQSRNDTPTAEKYTAEAHRLRGNIEANAWDGAWYRRAYFDDGTPLGSASNVECQIDSISQSWAVLSGAAPQTRCRQAMDNVAQRLIRLRDGLIQLLAPPFDKSNLNPGYIKGYVPGVRENGGQYTHAAIWTAMAYAELGASTEAWDLLALINPINHASEPSTTANYRVESYVVAADVYAVAPHIGRGGWTWYTGSAGWMYRLITEALLGIRLEVDRLHLTPRVPAAWKEFKIHYRYRETFYHIQVHNPAGGTTVERVLLDGVEQSDHTVPLQDDRRDHQVEVHWDDDNVL